MELLHYLTDDWKAALSGVGGKLLRLQYRRKNFSLLHTPRPIDRELETPDLWGVSYFLPGIDLAHAAFDLENYADGFGARYHRKDLELWIRYQFLPGIARQTIQFDNSGKTAMPLHLLMCPAFRLPQESGVEFTLGGKCRADRLFGKTAFCTANTPRPSGFAGALFHHMAKQLRIAYMVDQAYTKWQIARYRTTLLACTQFDALLDPGKSRTLTTAIAVSEAPDRPQA